MNKEDVIKYLKDNPRDIMDVADAFNLKVKYESFQDMRLDYQIIKRRFERAEKQKTKIRLTNLSSKITNMLGLNFMNLKKCIIGLSHILIKRWKTMGW